MRPKVIHVTVYCMYTCTCTQSHHTILCHCNRDTSYIHPFQTMEEFHRDYLTSGVESHLLRAVTHIHKRAINVTYPSSVDWRSKGFVTEVRTHNVGHT